MKNLILLLTLCPIFAFSQVSSPVLESYIQEGLKNNLALQQETFEIAKAQENVKLAKANFSPKITFAPTYTVAAGGRRLSFPVGDLLNPVYSTLNALTHSSVFPQVENVNELLAPNNFHDTKFSFQYPVYNTDIRYNLLIQRDLLSAQEAKKRIVENEVRYNITIAYLQYLQTLEAQKIFSASRLVLSDFVKLNEKLVNNNVATKDVVYSAEYEVSKLDQQVAVMDKNRYTAQAYLNFLMNRDFATEIVADTIFLDANIQVNIADTREQSIANRQEINQLKANIQASQSAIKLQEMSSLRPQVFIGGNTGFQGKGYTFKDQAYVVGQIGLTWDVFHGHEKRVKIQQAKIQKNQLETKLEEVQKQIQLQVSQAYFELEAAQKTLPTAKDGTIKAEKYFKVVDSRYRNGQAILVEYLRAQNEVITAKLQESLAKYDILLKKAMLDKVAAVR
ncbi:TolC family protein [Emticicia sp. BO119]|uniref:TolC family protein n=1 Tax=Emticicia sp. BO119 TaxID=2757768 RepID=UPI0015F00BEE|nr:TolC family protein [Emticicia sp. BO119]MBA4851763.1 TolC family protein [Emticicia sp. BO119]